MSPITTFIYIMLILSLTFGFVEVFAFGETLPPQATAVQAQLKQPSGPSTDVETNQNNLILELGLSPEQAAKLKATRAIFRLENKSQLDSLKVKIDQYKAIQGIPAKQPEAKALLEEIRNEADPIRTKSETNLKSVLTEDQWQTYLALRHQRSAQLKTRQSAPKNAPAAKTQKS